VGGAGEGGGGERAGLESSSRRLHFVKKLGSLFSRQDVIPGEILIIIRIKISCYAEFTTFLCMAQMLPLILREHWRGRPATSGGTVVLNLAGIVCVIVINVDEYGRSISDSFIWHEMR
jgi:hypothetical protein